MGGCQIGTVRLSQVATSAVVQRYKLMRVQQTQGRAKKEGGRKREQLRLRIDLQSTDNGVADWVMI